VSASSKPGKIPGAHAMAIILLSIVIVNGAFLSGWWYYRQLKKEKYSDPQYNITSIIQSTAGVERLKTVYLAEILQLSVDRPTNLIRFDVLQATNHLCQSPLIKEASVRKYLPGTIYIDYKLRVPVAFLCDFSNAAIDAEGVIFPFNPFFSPKKLPMIYLGHEILEGKLMADNMAWGNAVNHPSLHLAFAVLDCFMQGKSDQNITLQRIDVSRCSSSSFGQRQIIVLLEEYETKMVGGEPILFISPLVLRLAEENYQQQLQNYALLRRHLKEDDNKMIPRDLNVDSGAVRSFHPLVIDLRVSDLAFLSKSVN